MLQPSNAQLMDMLCCMRQDITETKEMKTELSAFRSETKDIMESLQTE